MPSPPTPSTPPGAYGPWLADRFRLRRAPAFVTQTLDKGELAVTLIRCDRADNGLTSPFPPQDALLIAVQLRDCPRHDLWLDGRPAPTQGLAAGAVSIYDLRRDPVVNSISPFRNLQFFAPRAALDALSHEAGVAPFTELPHNPGAGLHDDVLSGLAAALAPAFARPDEGGALFVDHVTTAFVSHLLLRFAPARRGRRSGPLEPRLWRRACELMAENPGGDLKVADLARACGLTRIEFLRAFRAACGLTPHAWLTQHRIERARDLLLRDVPPEAAARRAGFAHVGHMARAFRKVTGDPPPTGR